MAGISQHCKTGDVAAFGDSVGVASKALCGLTEAAGQVRSQHGHNSLSCSLLLSCSFKSAESSAVSPGEIHPAQPCSLTLLTHEQRC